MIEIPNFGELLAPILSQIPTETVPAALAQLERTAAERYREWASDVSEESEGLLDCAAREDEIADRVDAIFPIEDESRELIDSLMPSARKTYIDVFSGLTSIEQMTIQANAERQGAAAWRGMISVSPHLKVELEALSAIEEISADFLDALLKRLSPH
jgi:hypothetical protein